MPSQATVTGKVMGGIQATAKIIQNVESIHLDCNDKLLYVNDNNNVRTDFDISAATTMTVSLAGGNYTIVVS
jgi:hypothetical protein